MHITRCRVVSVKLANQKVHLPVFIPVRLYSSSFASICVFSHFAGTCGGPPEVQKSDPFGAGTSVSALRCNKCMAVLIGVFSGQPPLRGPLLSKP